MSQLGQASYARPMTWGAIFAADATSGLGDLLFAQTIVVATSIVTTLLTLGITKGAAALYRAQRSKATESFNLKLGIGPVWHLRKLHKPIATDFHYRIVMPDLTERPRVLEHPEIDPKVPGYGIWNLEVGDTLEMYWKERGKQLSTSVVIHATDREYVLRRENTGH
ncbi:hypothetical protein [Agromyces bauzanensis]